MSQLLIDLPPEISIDEARILLLAKLYETGKLSIGQAAQLSGYSKRAFIEITGKKGITIFDYPSNDLIEELNY